MRSRCAPVAVGVDSPVMSKLLHTVHWLTYMQLLEDFPGLITTNIRNSVNRLSPAVDCIQRAMKTCIL
jgi:hypothetical protein